MKQLNQSEIARTAFKYIPNEQFNSPYGYTSNRGKNEMCPYCKNEDTEIVRDEAHLIEFKKFYADKVYKGIKIEKFTVCHCRMCSAVWSFYAV